MTERDQGGVKCHAGLRGKGVEGVMARGGVNRQDEDGFCSDHFISLSAKRDQSLLKRFGSV